MFELDHPTQIESIIDPLFATKNVQVFLKREDQIDPEISGNKWRKLKYNFIEAKKLGHNKILTFGGAFSNHVAATAAAAKKYAFESTGIIRGDELNPDSNPTLRKAHEDGMKLVFVSRDEYKNRENQNWAKNLALKHEAFLVPEGGSNHLATLGVREMVWEIDMDFDYVVCPVGTGGTLAGIVGALKKNQKALGIAALNGREYLEKSVEKLLEDTSIKNWEISHDFTFGGYAKTSSALFQLMDHFKSSHGIALEPVYTAKMMYGLTQMIKEGFFPEGSRIIAIHTGGLQGMAGMTTI